MEQAINLDIIFGSLADPTRRDILRRVATQEMSVSQVAKPYDLSLAAISKHLKILEKAKLIMKSRRGKQHYVRLAPYAFRDAVEYLEWYRLSWEQRMDALEELLKREATDA